MPLFIESVLQQKCASVSFCDIELKFKIDSVLLALQYRVFMLNEAESEGVTDYKEDEISIYLFPFCEGTTVAE